MKIFGISLLGFCGILVAACDLQPKIASIPDSVGDFISVRYPALLADPDVQPEIYNSAASDYGVYASPELYGSVSQDDYVLYASVSDYIIPPQQTPDMDTKNVQSESVAINDKVADDKSEPVSDKSESEISDAVGGDMPSDEYLNVPMYGTLDLSIPEKKQSDVVTVARGDTLYSLARANNTTVADLVRINNLDASSSHLVVGQKLRVREDVSTLPESVAAPKSVNTAKVTETVPVTESVAQQVVIKNPTPTTTRVELQEITVAPGDTLYSISRRYSVPVNDLAVMNEISAPFGLRVGQRIKVPNLMAPDVHMATAITPANTTNTSSVKKSEAIVVKTSAPVKDSKTIVKKDTGSTASVGKKTTEKVSPKKTEKTVTQKTSDVSKNKSEGSPKQPTETKKISSDPSKKLPKIAPRSSNKFSWPVRGKILSHFGAKAKGLFNDGINISSTRGTGVKAAENGVVAYAGNEVKGMGNLVIIQHADGWMTVYGHMDSMIVRRGAKVTVGQKIGTVGATGRVDTPQLHFEIRKGTKAYDPIKYLKK